MGYGLWAIGYELWLKCVLMLILQFRKQYSVSHTHKEFRNKSEKFLSTKTNNSFHEVMKSEQLLV